MKQIVTILLFIVSIAVTGNSLFAINTNITSCPINERYHEAGCIFNNYSSPEHSNKKKLDELSVSCSSSNVTCIGASDGTASALASGGVFPYSYLWSNNASSSTIGGLDPGTYTIIVTDAEGSTIASSCVVGLENELQISCSSTPTSCDTSSNSCTGTTLVYWDLSNCGASYSDYTEFTPAYPNNGSCVNVSASNVYRNSGNHSCSVGQANGDGVAFCVGGFSSNSYVPNSSNAIRFSVNFSTEDSGTISALNFWEKASDPIYHLDDPTAINNDYPTKYGIRVLKNGTEIYLLTGLNTSTNYSIENFDLTGMEDFNYTGETTYEFELYAYSPVGNGNLNYIWDIDDISIEGCCTSFSPPPTPCLTTSIVEWDLANCNSSTSYSEFTPSYIDIESCNDINASIISRDSGFHSCNNGRDGGDGVGFCAGEFSSNNFISNAPSAIRFSVNFGAEDVGTLSALKFWELASDTIYYLNSSSPLINNYPTKYGVRVLKNGEQIYLQSNLNTSINYSLEHIDFSGLSDFSYNGACIYEFELFAFDPVGNGHFNYIWDIDDISLEGCCGTGQANSVEGSNCDGTISCDVSGGSGQYSFDWSYYEELTSSIPLSMFNEPDVSGLCPGSYCLLVTDLVTGCQDSICISIDEPFCTPIAVDDLVSVSYEDTTDIYVLLNDIIPNNNMDGITLQVLTGPFQGTTTVNEGDGIVIYIPDSDYIGIDSFTYVVCLGLLCDSATVTIIVTESHSDPIANDDLVSVNLNEPITIDVQANDLDPDGDPLLTSILTSPINGTAIVLNGDSIYYQPDLGFIGSEIITYLVSDGDGNTDTAAITIFVSIEDPENNFPIAVDDLASTDVQDPIIIDVQANDFDLDGDPLITFLISPLPSNGIATVLNGDSIIYIPDLGSIGTDAFTYVISDGNGGTDTATVSIDVSSLNNVCPTALDDAVVTYENITLAINPLENDSDPDGGIDPSSVNIVYGPINGTANVDPLDGQITYTPSTDFIGNDLILYEVCDMDLPSCCDFAFVLINVLHSDSMNTCPVVLDDDVNTEENVAITFDPLINDSDMDDGIDPSSITLVSGPVNGTASVDPSGTITYTPFANYNGNDLLAYEVCDLSDTECCEIAFVSINISPVNLCIATDDNETTDENVAITFDPLGNDTDFDTGADPSSLTLISLPLNGTANVDPVSGAITYTPITNFIGNDLVTYSVCDLNDPTCCDIANVFISVLPSNICPTVLDDNVSTQENMQIIFNPLVNDSDLDNGLDLSSISIISGPVNGTANADPLSGEITYTPSTSFIGNDVLTYSICDLNDPECCDIAFVSISVLPIIICTATDDDQSTNENGAITFDPLANDTGFDNGADPSSVTLISGPINGIANVDPLSGEITYTPNTNFTGNDLMIYSVCDLIDTLCCDLASISINVIACVNIPFSAIDDAISTEEDVPIVISVLDNDIDLEGDIDLSSLEIVTSPEHGSAQVNTITGTVLYQPELNYFGSDSFSYTVRDTSCFAINYDTAVVLINVVSVNDCPVAMNDTITTQQSNTVEIVVYENDMDSDGTIDPTSVFISGLSNGTANVDPITGHINYVPFTGFTGTDSLTYSICDDGEPFCCDTAIVYINVVLNKELVCIPKAFSPNGDQHCDLFEMFPDPMNYPNNELKVFNRWGNCVYSMNRYDNSWDGTSNTGGTLYGQEVHDGTYFYVFDLGNGDEALNGSVVIKRK